jgi:hypothetical protein
VEAFCNPPRRSLSPVLQREVGHVKVLQKVSHSAVVCQGAAIAKQHKDCSELQIFFLALQRHACRYLLRNGVMTNREEENLILQMPAVQCSIKLTLVRHSRNVCVRSSAATVLPQRIQL